MHPRRPLLTVHDSVLVQPECAAVVRRVIAEEWAAEFGEVWDFMGVNSVTSDLLHYRDAQHFDPEIGRLIADRLLERPAYRAHLAGKVV